MGQTRESYGTAILKVFTDGGAIPSPSLMEFILSSKKGWSEESRWRKSVIQAETDTLGFALACVRDMRRNESYMLRFMSSSLLSMKLVLDEKSLDELVKWTPSRDLGANLMGYLEDFRQRHKNGLSQVMEMGNSRKLWDVVFWWMEDVSEDTRERILTESHLRWKKLALDESLTSNEEGSGPAAMMDYLKNLLNLGEDETRVASRLLCMSATPVRGEALWQIVINRLNSESKHDEFGKALSLIEEGFEMEGGYVSSLFSEDGLFVRTGMAKQDDEVQEVDLATAYAKGAGFKYSTVRTILSKAFKGPLLSILTDEKCAPKMLLSQFVSELSGTSVNVESFEHIADEAGDIVKMLNGEKPRDILLWGPPGGGKTTLAQAVCHKAKKNIHETPRDLGVTKDGNVEQGQVRLEALTSAQEIAKHLGGEVLLIDEAESILSGEKHKYHLTNALERKTFKRIWVVNDLKGIHEAVLRRFDLIAHVPAMPQWARARMADDLFQDKGLAARVAQTMRTPAEIRLARTWCDVAGDESWAVVSRRMAGLKRAMSEAQRKDGEKDTGFTMEVRRPELDAGERMAGFPDLRRHLSRLAMIFDDPSRFAKLGAGVPKGVLLGGPPGTGKTMFARMLSEKAGVPLLIADSSALAQDPSRMGALFSEARKTAPCIVLLDEIDVLGATPVNAMGEVNLERQKVLNKLLVELDGFDPLEGVLVLGATHRPQVLDKAVTRSGRFGMRIDFNIPSREDRAEIWEVHLSDCPREADVRIEDLVDASVGFSCADIQEASNRARSDAAMSGKESVGRTDILSACDAVFWGADGGGPLLNESERWMTAIHEAGHAVMAQLMGRKVERATVKPRRDFLGAVQEGLGEGRVHVSRKEAMGEVCVCLAGLGAESSVSDSPTLGASSDLRRARSILWAYHLGCLGPGSMPGFDNMSLSESLRSDLESRVSSDLEACMERVKSLLEEESVREVLERLAATLLEMREMNGVEVAKALADLKPVEEPQRRAFIKSGGLWTQSGSETVHSEASDGKSVG